MKAEEEQQQQKACLFIENTQRTPGSLASNQTGKPRVHSPAFRFSIERMTN